MLHENILEATMGYGGNTANKSTVYAHK